MGDTTPNNDQSVTKWLNSPELKALRQAWQASESQQKAEDDAWWDSLNYDDKSQAFRQITKLMHKAEVQDRGSYRYALYDIFGLDYGDGLSYYMRMHNLIHLGLEAEQKLCKKDDTDGRNGDTYDQPE